MVGDIRQGGQIGEWGPVPIAQAQKSQQHLTVVCNFAGEQQEGLGTATSPHPPQLLVPVVYLLEAQERMISWVEV